ncbi:siderophore iron transporter, putative [Talaromyces stipitatus ATCC 10500]|uniref:Siderophore iron transporter, putative n=1 Tax=Talaromyces stipitatus (strain ATCC 10500 / CBS 375.48 / QM 6759 / NRRL 1006) TaxID=441959 RepID=B8LZV7_TALSN|nr:siderophore iron transporter, putative [Talaromyces stipitatus ATCC 10500]EED20889.1 siderophore iron transporter, putative [Talaromyces stipitatus ATCC 10500]
MKQILFPESKSIPDVSVSMDAGLDPHSQRTERTDADPDIYDEEIKPLQKWSMTLLLVTYFWILALLQWISVQEQASNTLATYIISIFGNLSSSPALSQAAYIVSGVIDIPLSKIIDIWGLDIGFLIMTFLNTLGLLMVAVCKNIATYAAAKILYQVGFHGITYVITVFIAELTDKKHRGIVLSITTLHSIAGSFAGAAYAQRFETDSTFRWAFAVLLIVGFVLCLPVWLVIRYHRKKAWKQVSSSERPPPNRRPWFDAVKGFCVQIDMIGVILFCSGLTLFFIPWTLAAKQENGWTSASILVMIVLGFFLLVALTIWERVFTPKSFLPFHCLRNRNILGTCILSFAMSLSNYCWDPYFRAYLQIVHAQSIANSGYIANIHWDGIAVGSILAGLLLLYTPHYKPMSLAALVLSALGSGLMIKFRHSYTNIGYVVMCQVFMAIGAGVLNITEYIALMDSKADQSTAFLFALSVMSSKIGIVIGQSISGGIWTNLLPGELYRRLPEDLKPKAKRFADSIYAVLHYHVGSVEREAIDEAYSAIQRLLTISGTSMLAFAFVGVFIWRRS